MALTTLQKYKTYAGISNTQDDANLQLHIDAASRAIEEYCCRGFEKKTYTEVVGGPGGSSLMLRNTPITSITSLSIGGQAVAAATSYGASGYRFSPSGLISVNGQRFERGVGTVEVTYVGGYDPIPPDVVLACHEAVMWGKKLSSGDRAGVASKSLAGETVSYIVSEMPSYVRGKLNPYRKTMLFL